MKEVNVNLARTCRYLFFIIILIWLFAVGSITFPNISHGRNFFSSYWRSTSEYIDSGSVALGDLDGDGDLDAWVTNDRDPSQVWLNDGSGRFTDSGQEIGGGDPLGPVMLGDMDKDGDLDALVESITGMSILFNDGKGFFSWGLSLCCGWSVNGALGDLDGDGDLDVWMGRGSSPNSGNLGYDIYFNDGRGNFKEEFRWGWGDGRVTLGDVDGDGDLDSLIADGPSSILYLNDGRGNFNRSGEDMFGRYCWKVVLGDLDGDGDLDAWTNNSDDEPSQVWLNDGSGKFTDSGQNLGDNASGRVALGDVDGDGDLDAWVANDSDPNRVWLNIILPPMPWLPTLLLSE